jgi:hypothetical protein
MAELTPQQRAIADAMINATFANPAMQTQGWTPNQQSQPSVDDMYRGIYPVQQPQQTQRPTQAQMQAIRDVPPSYSANPRLPGGAGQTIKRLASGEYVITNTSPQMAFNSPQQQNPAVMAATMQAGGTGPGPMRRPEAAPSRMEMAYMQSGPGPRPRPGLGIGGANPGMGGAMIGNGQMASGIPPQGPPPPGIAPTQWAGGNPVMRPEQAAPRMTSAQAYAQKNATAAANAKARQANLTGIDSMGRVLQNGQVVGTVRPQGQSSASYYAQQNSKNNSGAGSTSWGQSKTASDGTSWAANW